MTNSENSVFPDDNTRELPTDLTNAVSETGNEVELHDDASDHTTVAPKPTKPQKTKVKGSFAGTTYVSLVVGIILLILLLVFILQNQDPADINLFAWQWEFPIGVGMLFAAILGALITALIGGWRMFELRRQVRRAGQANQN